MTLLDDWIGRWIIVHVDGEVFGQRSITGKLHERCRDGIVIELQGHLHVVQMSRIVSISLPANQDDFAFESIVLNNQDNTA